MESIEYVYYHNSLHAFTIEKSSYFIIHAFISYFFPLQLFCQISQNEIQSWLQQARNVTIIRDNWGVPHVYGRSDADWLSRQAPKAIAGKASRKNRFRARRRAGHAQRDGYYLQIS